MGVGSDFGNVRQECRGLLRTKCPVALKVGLTFFIYTHKYDYITLLLKCLYKINLVWVKICFLQNKPQPLPCTPLNMKFLSPSVGRGWTCWVLLYSPLPTFMETVQRWRSLPVVVASAPDLPVVWAFTMLSCDVDCFINVVLALALAYFFCSSFILD